MERIKSAFRPLLRRHQDEAIGLVVGEPLARLVACYLRCEPRVQLDERWPCWRVRTDRDRPRPAPRRTSIWRTHRARTDPASRRSRARHGSDEERTHGIETRRAAERLAWALRAKRVPEGVWMRCDGCQATLFRKQVEQNLHRLPRVQPSLRRLGGANGSLSSSTPTRSRSGTPTSARRSARRSTTAGPIPSGSRPSRRATGLKEAAVVGQGFIKGIRIVFGLTDSKFIMGSMGSVVGEKLTRAIEEATRQQLPLVIVSGSGGGARMHEGIFSLMQMAKVSAAAGPLPRRRRALYQRPDPPDDGRRRGQLRLAGRFHPRRAQGPDRLCRPTRHRADRPRPAPRGLPDQRIPPASTASSTGSCTAATSGARSRSSSTTRRRNASDGFAHKPAHAHKIRGLSARSSGQKRITWVAQCHLSRVMPRFSHWRFWASGGTDKT